MTGLSLADVALDAAEVGARVASEQFRSRVSVQTKDGPMDPVTAADRDAQRAVVDRIHDAVPGDKVVAEEGDGPARVPGEGRAWVVDPVDGTANFAAGIRLWCTSVACVVDGRPEAGANVLPAVGDAYAAGERTTRNGEPVGVSDRSDPELAAVVPIYGATDRYRPAFRAMLPDLVETFGDARRPGSGQVGLSMVAAGELDAAVTTVRLDPWDAVTGVYLVRQAGGRATDLDGDPWEPGSDSLVASNGAIHEALLETFDPHEA